MPEILVFHNNNNTLEDPSKSSFRMSGAGGLSSPLPRATPLSHNTRRPLARLNAQHLIKSFAAVSLQLDNSRQQLANPLAARRAPQADLAKLDIQPAYIPSVIASHPSRYSALIRFSLSLSLCPPWPYIASLLQLTLYLARPSSSFILDPPFHSRSGTPSPPPPPSLWIQDLA
ncbi:hypothetical protein PGT21_029637 [Puccinia graminis f. sp. tritici]|uniref:Uncharacterized protein n=2 Tax=Puccinia graminis f. sp. tritici TaxID=56615 RepID=E3KPW1_PUCGT|nr:uncharacterized protein PGTG_12302 [Puccinia graminis f. sp. tritici CRL 75-36-700-3]EFP86346.1 hypothetical protein PGTG_12302 [Puccinia graminis f. sp. tritici CRL 75-36-700-3]KAA1081113.1 hypothetical protein PGT21_029637 [Puccinia graminis f. sp. tritici]KAA1131274.1 hypothetical protein PGTUg99_028964 [Puccinia graminis f. sp. tritici]